MPELTRPPLTGLIAAWWIALLVLSGCTPADREVPTTRKDAADGDGSPFSTAPEPAIKLWRRFGNAHQFEVGLYRNIGEMGRHSNQIVYGRVTAIARRRQPGAVPWARSMQVKLTILDTVKGKLLRPGDRATVSIGGILGPRPFFREKYGGILGDHALFFLNRAGAAQPEFGIRADPEYLALGTYRPVTPQGILLNDRGTVRWALQFGERGFPLRLDGTSFPDLIEKVKTALAPSVRP